MRLLLALLVTLVIFSTPVTAANSPLRLSDEQERRLRGGEVVLLDVLPPGGDAKQGQGGTAIGVVHASPQAVWRVLTDFRRHSGLYPRVVGAEVLEAVVDRTLVRYVVGVGPFSFGFHVNNYADDAQRRLVWRLARDRSNDLFHESWGYWQVDPDLEGARLTYGMAARTVLPAFLTRDAERDGLVATVKAVRERAEQAPL